MAGKGENVLKLDVDGKLFGFANKLIDVLLLNLLWLLFCLPLITAGAATVAAYSVALKMVDDEEGYVARGFLRAFRANFRQGTLLWLLNAAVLYALWLDWQLVTKTENPSVMLMIFGIVTAAVAFSAFTYAYPLLARYENSLAATIRNSLSISVRFFGKTLFLAALVAFEIAVFTWNVPLLAVGVLIGPMILAYTVSGIAKRIFERIEGRADK